MVSSAAAGLNGRGALGDDDGDISLSMGYGNGGNGAAQPVPLAAAPRRAVRDNGIRAPQAGRMWPPGAASQMRSSSARPTSTPDEGDVAERSRSAAAWRHDSPSPSPSTSTPRAHSQLHADSPTSPLSPLSGRRIARSHSLKVRIPSADLTAPRRDSAQSATSTTNAELTVPAAVPAPSPRPPPLIDDDTASRMARWVKEVVVCNFDLERGPVVERRAGGRRWGPGVKENVAFSSFPDTSLFTEGSIQFSFKIRHVPPDPRTLAYPEPPSPLPGAELLPEAPEARAGDAADSSVLTTPGGRRDKAAEYRRWDERGREWMYGFVWFQQRRDRGIARGYMQKSVVILTHLPLPALWNAVLERLAPAFFAHGYSALEVACHAFAAWPDPVPDARLELGLLSDVLNVKLPDGTENPQVALRSDPILAALPPSSPLRVFSSFISHLWSIWECLVLAEPVLVIAPDPRTCSEIVWWLRELLRPVPLAGDFRPYLHIHDHDFSLLVNSNKPQAGVVVGVTNPFFRNAASHWPNVIAVPSKTKNRPTQPGRQPEYPDGFISKRQRSVQKDRPLLKRLEALIAAGRLDDPEGNAALRTHFQQLTERFLVPLNRYFQTLVPPPTNGTNTPVLGGNGHVRPALSHSSSYNANIGPHPTSTTLPVPPPPPALSLSGLKPFSLPTFLSHLKTHGPNPLAFKSKGLLSKARVESDFYAAFCKGACFAGWLAARVESLGLAVAHSALAAQGLGTTTGVPNRYSPDPFSSARTSTSGTSTTTTDGTSGRSSSDMPASAATPRAELSHAATIPEGLTPIASAPSKSLPQRR